MMGGALIFPHSHIYINYIQYYHDKIQGGEVSQGGFSPLYNTLTFDLPKRKAEGEPGRFCHMTNIAPYIWYRCSRLSGGSKVIRGIIAQKEREPGNEAAFTLFLPPPSFHLSPLSLLPLLLPPPPPPPPPPTLFSLHTSLPSLHVSESRFWPYWSLLIADLCIACGDIDVVVDHPLFQGRLCKECKVHMCSASPLSCMQAHAQSHQLGKHCTRI